MSNFYEDLQKEQILASYLDKIYCELGFDFERVSDLNMQHQGVDIILYHQEKKYYVDEKAQLDYINATLPTFAFEISYLKNGNLRMGWLFDEEKRTEYYFLITAIYTNPESDLKQGINSLNIVSVNRKKLIRYLNYKGINKDFISRTQDEIRKSTKEKNIPISQLNATAEGCLYFSKHKAEQPINLKFYLKFLIDNKLAKQIY